MRGTKYTISELCATGLKIAFSLEKRAFSKCSVKCSRFFEVQALVTSLPESVRGIDVWREYNGRAGMEGVIKELDHGFALPKLCLEKFWATEAALSLAVMAYNVHVLFQRHLGWMERVTIGTMRFRLFQTAGVVSQAQGRTTVKLAVPLKQREWWRAIWEKILSEIPNCNAVGQQPEPA